MLEPRAVRARLSQFFALCSFKISVFLRVFSWTSKFATSKSMFRVRLPSIFIMCLKTPRRDSQKTRNTTCQKCCPCHEKCIFWKRCKNIAPATQKNEFRHVMKHVGMSKYHACHVKRGYATFETSKSDHFCRTRHRHGHSDLIVNGCRRLPTVADGCGRRSGVERARLHTRPPK